MPRTTTVAPTARERVHGKTISAVLMPVETGGGG
jgi:hypothetical protein